MFLNLHQSNRVFIDNRPRRRFRIIFSAISTVYLPLAFMTEGFRGQHNRRGPSIESGRSRERHGVDKHAVDQSVAPREEFQQGLRHQFRSAQSRRVGGEHGSRSPSGAYFFLLRMREFFFLLFSTRKCCGRV